MGLWDKIRGEFIDIIEWTQPNDSDVLAFRFPRYNNEIKMGAKLTVREGQAAVFVNEGQIADVFKPGMYELHTQNMPILSTLKGWKYGFNSPFKCEVYFIVTSQKTNNKWGTANPFMKRDVDFGMVRIRAFGTYVFHVVDPAAFVRELVSTDPSFETYEIDNQLRAAITSKFADAVGKATMPVLDMVGNYENLGKFALDAIQPDVKSWGLELTKFYVENISVPAEVEAAMDKRAAMGAVGDMGKFTQFQTAEAIRDAAQNPSGGAAGIGAGLGAGMGMANQMMGAMQGAATGATAAAPPPVPGQVTFHAVLNGQQAGPFDLPTLQSKLREGAVTRDTLVWKPGMTNWVAAGTIPELGALFAQVPPPVPG